MIKAVNISRVFGEGELSVQALAPSSFEIKQGEFVAITGPSGAGKSTLLYQLGLLDTPTSGRIFLDDLEVTALNEAQKTSVRLSKLGYVFQDYSLVPELTAEENVYLLLMAQGESVPAAKAKASQVLGRLGLSNRLQNYPNQLSGGEQQRVSIARAIAHNPIAILADEPTANLDSKTAQTVIDYLRQLNREGQTVVMVTHESEFSQQADRIIALRDGKIESDTRKAPAVPAA